MAKKIALIGFGTVGRSVVRLIQDQRPAGLELAAICNRNVERKRADWVSADVQWTDSVAQVLASDADIIVELVGGLDPAQGWIRQALERGKSVVTANKQVIAESGPELVALARQHNRHLAFEAAVAGGIPVVHGVKEGLAGDRLVRVVGILSGTCNYILTRMEATGSSFAEALAEAQKAGLAEADPSRDIDGPDARDKIAILSWLGLSRPVRASDVRCCSIRPIQAIDFVYARRLACAIRQVSFAEDSGDRGVVAWVQPALVPVDSQLARVQASQNVVVTTGSFGGETGFYGHGAGGDPTAVAVVSDLIAVAESTARLGRTWTSQTTRSAVNHEFAAPHYLRFTVEDRPGIIAAVATVLADHEININAVVQERSVSKSKLPFVITLEQCDATVLADAVHAIRALDFHAELLLSLPILL